MADSAAILTEEFAQQVERTVRIVLQEVRNPNQQRGRYGQRRTRRHQAVMVGALSAATEALASPATATAKLLKPDDDGDLEVTETEVSVTNRFEGIEVAAGTLVKIEFIDGEWQLYAADCVLTSIET